MSLSRKVSECAICLEDKNGFIAKLDCGHTYHYSCVQNWIIQKNNLKKCCCICEKDTEITNLFNQDNLINQDNRLRDKLLFCCTIL